MKRLFFAFVKIERKRKLTSPLGRAGKKKAFSLLLLSGGAVSFSFPMDHRLLVGVLTAVVAPRVIR